MIEGKIIASGSVSVENPFVLIISGSIDMGLISTSGAAVYCPSGASLYWAEQKDEK